LEIERDSTRIESFRIGEKHTISTKKWDRHSYKLMTEPAKSKKHKPKPRFSWDRHMTVKENYAKIGALCKTHVTPKDIQSQHFDRLAKAKAIPFPKVHDDGTVPSFLEEEDEEDDAPPAKRTPTSQSHPSAHPDKSLLEGEIEDPLDLLDEDTFLPSVDLLKSMKSVGLPSLISVCLSPAVRVVFQK
jgi:hypothetical protein